MNETQPAKARQTEPTETERGSRQIAKRVGKPFLVKRIYKQPFLQFPLHHIKFLRIFAP